MKEEHHDPEIIVGLDIGTTKIATVIGFLNEEEDIEVIGFGRAESTGVQYGVIQNIKKTVEGIKQSVEESMERSNVEIVEVYSGIAGRHIHSMVYKHEIARQDGKNSVIEQQEIQNMVNAIETILLPVGKKIITVIPQNFVIDGERKTTDPVGEMGELIVGYFQVIIGDELEMKKIVRCINEAKIKVKNIILEPLASGLSCLTHEEKQRGVVLVDIGGGTTDVAIFYQGNPVHTEVIPFGGEVITRDIEHNCRISRELAEKLKIMHGTCIVEKSNRNNMITIPDPLGDGPKEISEHHLALIIEARVKEVIIKPIIEIIENSTYKDKLTAGVVITGGGAMLRHLKELFQYSLVKPTRIGRLNADFSRSLNKELLHPMYATALGLLKYGIRLAAENSSASNINKGKSRENTKPPSKPGTKNISNSTSVVFDYIQTFLKKILEATE